MENIIIGRLESLSPEEIINTKSGTQLVKRTIVLDCSTRNNETGETYDNPVQLEFVGKAATALAGFSVGREVRVAFSLRGNRWQKDGKERIFTSIRPYRIEAVPQTTQQVQPYGTTADDMPF